MKDEHRMPQKNGNISAPSEKNVQMNIDIRLTVIAMLILAAAFIVIRFFIKEKIINSTNGDVVKLSENTVPDFAESINSISAIDKTAISCYYINMKKI